MKRYDIDVQPDRSYYGDGTAFIPVPYESDQGDWVRQEDVDGLLALNAEMLEALKLAAHYVERELTACEPTHEGFCGPWMQCDTNCEARTHISEDLFKIKGAIAKAKGEQP